MSQFQSSDIKLWNVDTVVKWIEKAGEEDGFAEYGEHFLSKYDDLNCNCMSTFKGVKGVWYYRILWVKDFV